MDSSLPALVKSLSASLESALEAVPKELKIPTASGISLHDVKNELFLSYVQNLVFLIILKIRNTTQSGAGDERQSELSKLNGEVVQKLAELRLYVEKGVRPLENRLKYQIDKAVRAAEDATRTSVTYKARKQLNGHQKSRDDGDEDSEEGSGASSDEDDASVGSAENLRPNPGAILQAMPKAGKSRDDGAGDGIYRPPRINPVAMPTTDSKERRERRPNKSATMDEFIATELSTAPVAEPSIGSTIVAGGRRNKSQRERDQDAERRAYEESNFMRLPNQSKKERRQNGRRDGGFGGEEWRNLGAGLDRIERLTQKKAGSGGSLARSQKRKFDTVDGPRGSGEQIGTMFAKRQAREMKKSRRR
jgi:U3 small nucleolar ribonucleoprotein protein LCP5